MRCCNEYWGKSNYKLGDERRFAGYNISSRAELAEITGIIVRCVSLYDSSAQTHLEI